MKLLSAATSTVAAAFLLAGSNSAYAESPDNYEFPECADERGVQVPYVENFEGSGSIVLRFNVRYLDDENLEQPAILYNRGFFERMPELLRDFVVAHECYHFSSGDARYAYDMKPASRRLPVELHTLIEDNANCAAAHALRDGFGYSLDDLDRLESQIGEYVSRSQAEEDMPVIRACFRQEQPMPVPVRQTMEHQ